MFDSLKSKLIGAGAVVAAAAPTFASEGTSNTVAWWPTTVTSSVFDGILTTVAPIAIAVVVGVSGVRVAIKLINRGAGR